MSWVQLPPPPLMDFSKGKKILEDANKYGRKFAKIVRDVAFLARKLNNKEKFQFSIIDEYLKNDEKAKLLFLIKQQKAFIKIKKKGWSFLISGKDLLPRVFYLKPEKRTLNPDFTNELETKIWLEKLDKKIKKRFFEKRANEFATKVWQVIPQFIAPNLIINQHMRQALALQLFSKEPLHYLLICEDQSILEKIYKSIIALSPAAVLASQNSFMKNLVNAHKNIFIISDIQKYKNFKAKLYDAMEFGFIKYVKPNKTYKLEAQIKVLAGSNKPTELEDVNNFHLQFEVRESLSNFSDIAKKLIAEDKISIKLPDIVFIQKYIRIANNLNVEMSPELADKIAQFVANLKDKEKELKFPITAKTVIAISRLVKASARMELRTLVEAKDLERVFNIIKQTYERVN
ncbi:MAG: hypothetical protein QW625_00630 [Candidatus Nanoarchaeia archaeon]